MDKLVQIRRRMNSEAGISMLEYAVAAAALLGSVAVAMGILGGGFESMFTNISDYAETQTESIGAPQS